VLFLRSSSRGLTIRTITKVETKVSITVLIGLRVIESTIVTTVILVVIVLENIKLVGVTLVRKIGIVCTVIRNLYIGVRSWQLTGGAVIVNGKVTLWRTALKSSAITVVEEVTHLVYVTLEVVIALLIEILGRHCFTVVMVKMMTDIGLVVV
jgi:hypothetical protein